VGAAAQADEPGGVILLPLIGISFGYFMVLLDMTVLSVAEPNLAASLHTSISGLQWATTGYTVPFAALLLSAGAVADRYGADRVFRAGVACFGDGSLLSAFASDLGVLVLLRAVLGVAAAAIVPASLAMVARMYPVPAERARAIALWASISGAAVAAGPVAGGLLVEFGGWHAIFYVNGPIALLVLGLTAGRKVTCPGVERRIDWLGQIAACMALALLTDALIAAGSRAWRHALLALAGFAAATVLFAWLERRSATPVLNRALLGARRLRAGLLAGAAVNFALTGELFVLPLLFQQGRHLTPAGTGLALLPLTLPFVLLPLLTGWFAARSGAGTAILAGLGLLTAGGIVLGACALSGAGYGWLAFGLLLTGTGVPFALPSVVTAVVNAAPDGAAGAAGGLLNSVRQAGATVGVAVMGAFVNPGAGSGTGWPLLLAAACCAMAGVVFRVGARQHPRLLGGSEFPAPA
jgi:DHA2 family methylenomycin A resistance protein-like MFS transporter